MKAMRFHQHGGPEVLELEDVPTPVPASGEVRVRVRACALNHLDLFIRQGMAGVKIAMPHVLGADIAGEREDTGERVIVAPGVGCGHCHWCLEGEDNRCPGYQIFGNQRDGGYAEYVNVPERALLAMPKGMSFVEAASVPLVFLTAWNMLVRKAAVAPAQTVLVWAASSGVGIAAVQLAKLFGCRVIATAGGAEKGAKARALGADEVIDHYDSTPPVSKAVKRLAPGGVDIVLEHVGQATWDESLRSMMPGGVLVTCGATTGYEAKIDLRFLFSRQLRLMGSYMGRRADLDPILAMFSRGLLHPVVDRTFPLAQAAAAHRYLAEKRQFGKVVLEV